MPTALTDPASCATEPASSSGIDWVARRAAREAELLASYDPNVPGLPGDGTPMVVHTDPDRGLTYTWHDLSPRPQDFNSLERGYLVSRLAVTHASGHEVGHLNVTSTTRDLLAAVFATPFHWADENTSASFGFRWAAEDGKEVSRAKIWATAVNHLRLVPTEVATRRWTYGPADAPADPADLDADLAVAEKAYARQMRGFARFLSTPFVDYAHVDDAYDAARAGTGHPGSLRGTGVGRAMYLVAARHLAATRGMVLRASGLQSEQAPGLWARLVADPAVPTRRTRVTYWQPGTKHTGTYWCIDYTRAGSQGVGA